MNWCLLCVYSFSSTPWLSNKSGAATKSLFGMTRMSLKVQSQNLFPPSCNILKDELCPVHVLIQTNVQSLQMQFKQGFKYMCHLLKNVRKLFFFWRRHILLPTINRFIQTLLWIYIHRFLMFLATT